MDQQGYAKAYIEAKSQGYSDDEIAQHLAGDGQKYQDAVSQGYSPQDVIQHFVGFDVSKYSNPSTLKSAADFQGDLLSPGHQYTDPTVMDAQTVYGLYKTPEALSGLYNLGKAGLSAGINGLKTAGNYIGDMWNARSAAEAAAPAEDALSAGLNAKGALTSESNASKAINDALYARIPQDTRLVTPTLNDAADNVIQAQSTLPKSFQSSGINKMASDLQDLGKESGTPFATLKDIRSQLSDLAYNGEGTDKAHAAQLLKALNSDIETASPPLPPSQQPTAFAQDLRGQWADLARQGGANGLEDLTQQGAYVNPNTFQGIKSNIPQQNLGQDLNYANQFYKQRMDLMNHPVTQALQRARPEEMGAAIFKRGNVDDVRVGQAVLGPTGYKSVQGQFYNQLMNAKDIGAKLAKYSPEFLNEALGPTLLKNLQNLAEFKSLMLKAATTGKLAGSAAGVGGAVYGINRLIH